MNKIYILIVVIPALLLVIVSSTTADIYSWVDEKGVKHFSNSPVNLDKKGDVSVQNETKYVPSKSKKMKPKKSKKIEIKKVERSRNKVPEKKYSEEELKKIDKEIRSTWGNMKESLKRGK